MEWILLAIQVRSLPPESFQQKESQGHLSGIPTLSEMLN